MANLLKYAALTAIVLALALPAHADVIQTRTFGPQLVSYNQALTFNQYDGSDGTLTGITIELSVETGVDYLGTNRAGWAVADNDSLTSIARVDMEFGSQGRLFSGDVTIPNDLHYFFGQGVKSVTSVSNQSLTVDTAGGDGITIDGSPTDGYLLAGASNLTTSLSRSVASGDWGDYSGSSTFNISVYLDSWVNINVLEGAVQTGSDPAAASGILTVTYSTTGGGGAATPEPASMLLLASGLSGVAAWRYRRRRQRKNKHAA